MARATIREIRDQLHGAGSPFTRIHEHKHFAPWEKHDLTVASRSSARKPGRRMCPTIPNGCRPTGNCSRSTGRSAESCAAFLLSAAGHVPLSRYGCSHRRGAEFSSAFVKSRQLGAAPPLFPNQEGPIITKNIELAVVMPIIMKRQTSRR